MSMNMQTFQPRTTTGKLLLYLWDMIDISENLRRVERWVRGVDNGLTSLFHAAGMLGLFLVAVTLAWTFDIKSTLNGLATVREFVIPSLPEQVLRFTTIVVVALTFAPTLMELLTAGMAKENIKIIQIAIIGFTFFDLVTDIPVTYSFAMALWPNFELLAWGVSHVSFWIFFFVALLFSTLGFELASVLFGYALIAFIFKSIGVSATQQVRVQQPQKQKGGTQDPKAAVAAALKNIQAASSEDS